MTRLNLFSRFSPANIEQLFSKYAHTVPDKFSLGELWDMTEGNRVAYDLFGWYVNLGLFSFYSKIPFRL